MERRGMRRMKKIWALVICLAVVMSTLDFNVPAEETVTNEAEQDDGIIRGSAGRYDDYYWEFNPTTETLTFFGWMAETYTCQEIEEKVKHLVFSDSVHDVFLSGADVNFPNLEDVYLSKSVSTFSMPALGKGGNLKEYIVDNENDHYESIDGNLYYYGGSQENVYLQGYATAKQEEVFEVPDNTAIVYDGALAGSKNLKTLILAEKTGKFYVPLYKAETIKNVIVPNKECKFEYYTNRTPNPNLTIYSWPDANIKGQCEAYRINFKEIPLNRVQSIEVMENPVEMTVMRGQTYSFKGMKLNVRLDDGTTRVVTTGYTVSGLNTSKVGVQTITIQMGEAKTTLDIEVLEIPEEIHLTPDKKLSVSLLWNKDYYEYNQVCYFAPEESGLYSIFTEGLYDTYLVIENGSGFSKTNDNGGASENAQLDVYLKKGTVYTVTVSSLKKIQCNLAAKLISTKLDDGITVRGYAANTNNDVADTVIINYTLSGLIEGQKLYYTKEPGVLEKNVDGVWQEVPMKKDYVQEDFKNIEITDSATISLKIRDIYDDLTTAQYRYTHQIGGKKAAVKFNLYNIENEDSENILIKNTTKKVHCTTKENQKIYYIKADVWGLYKFHTTGEYDTSVVIRKINNTLCVSDDNSGENNNFKVAFGATEGVTYKVIVSVKNLSQDADFDLIVEGPCLHNYEKTIVEATCVSKGYTIYTCSDCGHSYIDDYVDELGHDCVVETVAPTCTQDGNEHGKCTRCDYEYDKAIKAPGHIYETITVKATEKNKGYVIERCLICDFAHILEETDFVKETDVTKETDIVKETKPVKNLIVTNIKKIKTKKKKLTITWKRKKKISGYQIQVSRTKGFKKALKKRVKASNNKIVFKKLKSKKRYYVRIRTYIVLDGKKVYSAWGKVKNKVVK